MNPNPTGNVTQVNRAELNLVKPTYFHGTDNEDPYEWLASFERAATANQWTTVPGEKNGGDSFRRYV
jgi:hypothetical protein